MARLLGEDEKLIVIGPTPPPINGVAFATPHVLDAVRAIGRLAAHLDTSDPRPVTTTGRFDLRNAWLGVRHALELVGLLVKHRRAAVYIPISQVTWGFVRDAGFVWTATIFRRRIILHLHGGHFRSFASEAGPVMRRFIAVTVRRVTEAWVLTPAHLEMFEGLIPQSRVSVLQNTAEDHGSRLTHESGDQTPERTRRFLFLSNLLREKGCFDLLEAFDLLDSRVEGTEVRFVGEADREVLDELGQWVERLARKQVTIRYEGALLGPAKTNALTWAQVFVLPSRYPLEGQPLAILEAMSAGIPVISSDHSGIPHTVRDGEEGLIVPPGDIGELRDAIARLLGAPKLRDRMAAAARRRYLEVYRPELFHAAVAELLLGPPDPQLRS